MVFFPVFLGCRFSRQMKGELYCTFETSWKRGYSEKKYPVRISHEPFPRFQSPRFSFGRMDTGGIQGAWVHQTFSVCPRQTVISRVCVCVCGCGVRAILRQRCPVRPFSSCWSACSGLGAASDAGLAALPCGAVRPSRGSHQLGRSAAPQPARAWLGPAIIRPATADRICTSPWSCRTPVRGMALCFSACKLCLRDGGGIGRAPAAA